MPYLINHLTHFTEQSPMAHGQLFRTVRQQFCIVERLFHTHVQVFRRDRKRICINLLLFCKVVQLLCRLKKEYRTVERQCRRHVWPLRIVRQ